MPFRFAVRVYIEDTDIGGIVYYVNYLKFMERARTEFLRAHAVEQQLLQQQGYLFVVKSLNCDYKHSAKLDDQLEVTVTIDKIKAASVVFVQSVLHQQKVLCSAVVEVVCVSTATMRPIRFPQQIKQIFASSIDAD
ncbi:MAG: tol-pal system-associated acyl-CoA thioesterase [Pseudomonadales bacterium]|nr:tol-pal system-associated acyl-CoA thioesterase [Pseudomonadales bacterium]